MANGSLKTSAQLRTAFLEFFETHGHKRVASSPLFKVDWLHVDVSV